MDFGQRRIRKVKTEGELEELYPHDLQMYTLPPACEISLIEFEQLPIDRLKVLRIIEQINSLGHAKSSDDWKKAVADEIKKRPELKSWYKLVISSGTSSKDPDYSARRMDHLSHFILRLAFCQSEDQRRWMISREMDLFRMRWLNLSSEGRSTFIKINNLNYDVVSQSDRLELAEKSGGFVVPSMEYYRVPFTMVLDLVRHRKVYLRAGFAYITSTDIISVLLTVMRTKLAQDLARFAQRLPHVELLEEDQTRLFRPLKALPLAHIGEDYSQQKPGTRVPIENIDALSSQSFALCMRQLHSRLRTEHKLRHHGRLQYSLFLKGIGVTLDDVLTMWRAEWAQVEPEKFEKGVSYLLRHAYGKEGKRTNYTPHSCMKIINTSVGQGDEHGCPFKHNDIASVRLTLTQTGASSSEIQETIELINRSQYGLACTKYFEMTHKALPQTVINHPVQYFEESLNLKSGKSSLVKKEPTGIKTTTPSSSKPKVEENLWGDFADDELMNIDAV